jgi:hypothetical protein
MMTDDLRNDKPEELFSKCRVEASFGGKGPKALDLLVFAGLIRRRKPDFSLVFTDRLGDLETLCEHANESGVNVVNTCSIARQTVVVHGAFSSVVSALETLAALRP